MVALPDNILEWFIFPKKHFFSGEKKYFFAENGTIGSEGKNAGINRERGRLGPERGENFSSGAKISKKLRFFVVISFFLFQDAENGHSDSGHSGMRTTRARSH